MASASLNLEHLALAGRLAESLGTPAVDGLYLPAPVPDETFRDEFGFVLLADGSVGPFYVSLGDLLQRLWREFPRPAAVRAPVTALLDGFTSGDLARRALAVGAYNALSASLYRAAGYEPPDRAAQSDLPPRARVGMVGYFCPLVDRLTARGCEVVVLEQAVARVERRTGVSAARDAGELRGCAQVICTASTLVNDSLEALLAEIGDRTPVALTGPSGSGVPDPLFRRGVHSIGGIHFADREQLLAQLARGEPWGSAGRKYEIERGAYPGVESLLARLGR